MAEKSRDRLQEVREYSLEYYGEILESYERLGKYSPDAMIEWINLRKALFKEPPEGALTLREKELIATAVEIATRKPTPQRHAKLAIDAGATVEQVAEVAGLCILLGGMMTYMVSGQHALKAAEERARELGRLSK